MRSTVEAHTNRWGLDPWRTVRIPDRWVDHPWDDFRRWLAISTRSRMALMRLLGDPETASFASYNPRCPLRVAQTVWKRSLIYSVELNRDLRQAIWSRSSRVHWRLYRDQALFPVGSMLYRNPWISGELRARLRADLEAVGYFT